MQREIRFILTLILPFVVRWLFQMMENHKITSFNKIAREKGYSHELLQEKPISFQSIFNSSLEFLLTITGLVVGFGDVSQNFEIYMTGLIISILLSIGFEIISNEELKFHLNLLIIIIMGIVVYFKTFPIATQGDKAKEDINNPYTMFNDIGSDTTTSNVKALCFDIVKGKKIDVETFKKEAMKIKNKELQGLITAYFFMKTNKEKCKRGLNFVTSDIYKTDKNYIFSKIEPSNDSLFNISLLSSSSWIGLESDSIKIINEKIIRSRNASIRVKIFDCSAGYKIVASGVQGNLLKERLQNLGISEKNIIVETPAFDIILDESVYRNWRMGHELNTRYYLNPNSNKSTKIFEQINLVPYDRVGKKIQDLVNSYDCIIVIGKQKVS